MGKIQIIDDFYSPLDKCHRTLRIYTPASYDKEPNKSYPVIYMTDGQNVFAHPESARFDTWCVNRSLETLWDEGKLEREWIVCAIDHLPDRFAEYTPWAYPSASVHNPLGRRFLNNFTEFFVPFMNANYRTLKGPKNTAFIGSSLGGLMALFCGRERPDVIGRIGAVSPSVMWSDYKTFQHWNSKIKTWTKIYLDMGSEENITIRGIYLDYVAGIIEFHKHLMGLGYGSHEVHLYIEEGAIHYEVDWARRFPYMAQKLLND